MTTIWLTGMPCSGKTTLAYALHELIKPSVVLDGDEVRKGMCAGLGFSFEGRAENVRRVSCACKIIEASGVTAIVALVSPDRIPREDARRRSERFIEVHLATPYRVCLDRDDKGTYKNWYSDSITSTYEPPDSPEVVVEPHLYDVKTCAAKVVGVFNAGI